MSQSLSVEGNGGNQERGKGYIRGTERQWLGKAAPSASSQTHRIFSPHPLFAPTSHSSNYPSRTRLAATSHRYPPRAPQSKKTPNSVVKLQFHLQPVKQRKPGHGLWQRQLHGPPAPQRHPQTGLRLSVPAGTSRQPADPA